MMQKSVMRKHGEGGGGLLLLFIDDNLASLLPHRSGS
jgi:hypothetical protein